MEIHGCDGDDDTSYGDRDFSNDLHDYDLYTHHHYTISQVKKVRTYTTTHCHCRKARNRYFVYK